jgi:hypothetical protein
MHCIDRSFRTQQATLNTDDKVIASLYFALINHFEYVYNSFRAASKAAQTENGVNLLTAYRSLFASTVPTIVDIDNRALTILVVFATVSRFHLLIMRSYGILVLFAICSI